MFCNGQVLPIATYAALYSVLGTRYGGDGMTTFALPDLRGRIPIAVNNLVAPDRIVTAPVDSQGNPTRQGVVGDTLGANVKLQSAGAAAITLGIANLPPHTHIASAAPATSTVEFALEASLDGGQSTTPMDGGYLATTVASGASDSSIYRADLGSGSVTLAKSTAQVNFTPSIVNSTTGLGQTLNAPVTAIATSVPTPPFLAMQYIICIEGLYPMRN